MPTSKETNAALAALMSTLTGDGEEIEIVTKAEIDEMLTARFETFSKTISEGLAANVEVAVQKAMPAPDREGVGRKGIVQTADELRDEDPGAYIAAKAQKPEEMTQEDKQLAFGIMYAALKQGMRD